MENKTTYHTANDRPALHTVASLSLEVYKRTLREAGITATAMVAAKTHTPTVSGILTEWHVPLTMAQGNTVHVCDIITGIAIDADLSTRAVRNDALAAAFDAIYKDLDMAGFVIVDGEFRHARVTWAYCAFVPTRIPDEPLDPANVTHWRLYKDGHEEQVQESPQENAQVSFPDDPDQSRAQKGP